MEVVTVGSASIQSKSNRNQDFDKMGQDALEGMPGKYD